MPSVFVLNEGNTCAFESLGKDHERLLSQPSGREHFENLVHVMTIDHFSAPAERLKSFLVNIHVVTKRSRLTLSEAIDVDDPDQVVELINAGKRSGFPDVAFGDFAVTHEHVSFEIELVESRAERHADADAQAL